MLQTQKYAVIGSLFGGRKISGSSENSCDLPGLLLFFEKGTRPSCPDVGHALRSSRRIFVSHDSSRSKRGAGEGALNHSATEIEDCWLELVADGLTFDLLGLAGGPALAAPEVAHRFGTTIELEGGDYEAFGLFPGPHLAEGANSLPIVRTMVGIANELAAAMPGVGAFYWSPARSLMEPAFYTRVVEEWLAGGPFPALGLIGYAIDDDGALRSDGLTFLADREIAVLPPLSQDRIFATRLAVRVANLLVGSLPPEETLAFRFEGRELRLRPSPDCRSIFVESN